MSELLSIKLIKQNSSLQPRAKMDTAIIDEYTEAMKGGAAFPAVIVYKVGEEYYLVDGYHRYLAVQGAKFDKILADVKTGTMREAILFSAGVNATHGIRRTNDDKRRAVLILLKDKEWGVWSDTKIASICNVSSDLVGKIRKSILPLSASTTPEKRKVERAGKVIKMDTSKIGKRQDPAKCFSPQPGSIKTTDLPPQLSLADQVRQKEMAEAAANQQTAQNNEHKSDSTEHKTELPDAPIAATLKEKYNPSEIPNSSPPSFRAPCLDGKPCPEGGAVVVPDANKPEVKKCSVSRGYIFQANGKSALLKDECLLLAAAWKKAHPAPVEAFTTADKLNSTGFISRTRQPEMMIKWNPAPAQQSFLHRVMRLEGLDTPEEALSIIVDTAMSQEVV